MIMQDFGTEIRKSWLLKRNWFSWEPRIKFDIIEVKKASVLDTIRIENDEITIQHDINGVSIKCPAYMNLKLVKQ